VTDTTAQRQFEVGKEIVRIFATGSEDDMYGDMLDVVLKALDSTIGIFGYVDETGTLVCPSLTREVWDECQIPGKDIRFPRESWGGIWGRAMLEQKARYSNEPFEVPGGHVPVLRTIDVPLVHAGELVGNLMVGNKATDYDDEDLRLLQSIGDMIAPVLHARVQRDQQERQREKAEQALREAHYRQLFDAATDMIVVQDPETGAILDVNAETVRASGYTREEFLSGGVSGFSPPGEQYSMERAMGYMQRAAAGEPQLFEWGFVDKGGEFHPTEVHLKLAEIRGEPCLLGVIRDITERKRVELERQQLEHQMQQAQKLESLGVLAGGIAHDFNNLLMAILGNASLALMKLRPESPGRDHLQKVETAAKRAAELTNQMLAYSGKGKFVVEPLCMSRVVEEMSHLLGAVISKKVVLKFDFTDDLPPIEADASQIRQVVMNLILNGSDAIGDTSGVVTVSTGVVQADRSYLSGTYLDWELPEGYYVYVEISDTGHGMDAETQRKIFDPFFTTKFSGRGLGLAAVLGIVRGHHGAVKVYSEVGKGTTVKVLLPAAEEPEPVRVVKPRAAADWRGHGLVLVVDDEEMIRDTARMILEAVGFDVLLAEDGREAVEVFRERGDDIRVVLLDMTMPHMGGEEAFTELRRIRDDVRVILSSGYNEQEATNRFAGKGLAGFIQKPYPPMKLAEILRGILGD
jgi:two-component system, cell cycle sensor histidine kinase and response regulator CckA